jgi:hypothetical protein
VVASALPQSNPRDPSLLHQAIEFKLETEELEIARAHGGGTLNRL